MLQGCMQQLLASLVAPAGEVVMAQLLASLVAPVGGVVMVTRAAVACC